MLMKRFGSVSVLNGHIHQVMQKVEGNITFHTARSTAFPQPEPGKAESPGPDENSRRKKGSRACWDLAVSVSFIAKNGSSGDCGFHVGMTKPLTGRVPGVRVMKPLTEHGLSRE